MYSFGQLYAAGCGDVAGQCSRKNRRGIHELDTGVKGSPASAQDTLQYDSGMSAYFFRGAFYENFRFSGSFGRIKIAA
jgi:hypothetical protein